MIKANALASIAECFDERLIRAERPHERVWGFCLLRPRRDCSLCTTGGDFVRRLLVSIQCQMPDATRLSYAAYEALSGG